MKITVAFALLVAGLLGSRSVSACTCMGPTDGVDAWTKAMVNYSEHVFLGRITKVSNKPISKMAMFDSASVEILQRFKGEKTLGGVDSHSLCQSFRLVAGETRVFFVDANGIILGCTEYKYFANQEKMISSVKRALSQQ